MSVKWSYHRSQMKINYHLRNPYPLTVIAKFSKNRRYIDGSESTLSAKEKDELLGDSIAKNINRIMINRFNCTCEYLQDIEVISEIFGI